MKTLLACLALLLTATVAPAGLPQSTFSGSLPQSTYVVRAEKPRPRVVCPDACDCGCGEGGTCTCFAAKAKPKAKRAKAVCSSACTCGCQELDDEGWPGFCRCEALPPPLAVVPAVSRPMFYPAAPLPPLQPQVPAMTLPAWQPVRPAFHFAPAFSQPFRGSGGCSGGR